MGKKFKNKILSDDGFVLLVQDNQGKTFTISKEDEWVLENYWAVKPEGYVHRGIRKDGKRIGIYLHRFLMNAPDDMQVDHKDMNKSNNCRDNLRIATSSQNISNRDADLKRRKSKYKGVYWKERDKKWIAMIICNNKKYYLGNYKTQEEAAFAYNKKALELHGEFALLNIIQNNLQDY